MNKWTAIAATTLSVTFLSTLALATYARMNRVKLSGHNLESITVNREALYPEGIEHDASQNRFLLSSVREGTVFEVSENGDVNPFIQDKRLISSTGIHIDAQRNRILVPNSDYGVSLHSTPETLDRLAGLGIYDLTTGALITYADLDSLKPGEAHFANDVTVDDAGNAYVSDSLSPIVYKVTPEGETSIFLEDSRFTGEGFNLNGIVFHPDGYLIVAKKSDGRLFRVPIDNPDDFSEIQVERDLIGTDGLILADNQELIAITNRSGETVSNEIFSLHSEDGWHSAVISDSYPSDDDYPSTGIIRDGKIYVIKGQLHEYTPETTEFIREFEIEQIGSVIN